MKEAAKEIIYCGSALKDLQGLDSDIRSRVAFQLDRLKNGLMPTDFKPMKTIGLGVNEIRIKAKVGVRVIYVAKFGNAIYILHAFKKKSQKTAREDIEIAKARYQNLVKNKK
jgi:phage-related protein